MSILSIPAPTPKRVIDFTTGIMPPDIQVIRESTRSAVSRDGIIRQVPNNIPAFEWRDNRCMGLLIGGAQTNLLKYSTMSEDVPLVGGVFDRWVRTSSIQVTASPVAAPDGSMQAARVYRTESTNLYQYCRYYFEKPLSETVCRVFSFYVRPETSSEIDVILCNDALASSRARVAFRLTGDGQAYGLENNSNYVSEVDYHITRQANGWYRVWLRCKFNESAVHERDHSLLIYPGERGKQITGESIDLWGMQFEEAYLPGPYIATNGVQESSAMDLITTEDSMNYGTMIVSFDAPNLRNSYIELSLIGFGNISDQNRMHIRTDSGEMRLVSRYRRNNQDLENKALTPMSGRTTACFGMSISPTGIITNDGLVTQKSELDLSSYEKVSGLYIGSWVNTVNFLGTIKRIALYSQALTEEQLKVVVKLNA